MDGQVSILWLINQNAKSDSYCAHILPSHYLIIFVKIKYTMISFSEVIVVISISDNHTYCNPVGFFVCQ